MTSKKYSILEDDCKTVNRKKVYRIRAMRSIEGIVSTGETGGYVEAEKNLSHEGRCWIRDEAVAMGWSEVSEDAQIRDNAKAYGHAKVSGRALVYNSAEISGRAMVTGNASIFQKAEIYGDALVSGNAIVYDEASIMGMARIDENARVFGRAVLSGNVVITGNARIFGSTVISKGTFSSGAFNHDELQSMVNTFRLSTMPEILDDIHYIGEMIKKEGMVPRSELGGLKSRLLQYHRMMEGYKRFLVDELEIIDGLLETYRMFIEERDHKGG